VLLKLDDKYIQLWNFFAIPLVAIFGVFITKVTPATTGTFSFTDKLSLWIAYVAFASMNVYGLLRVVNWQIATAKRMKEVVTIDKFDKDQAIVFRINRHYLNQTAYLLSKCMTSGVYGRLRQSARVCNQCFEIFQKRASASFNRAKKRAIAR